MKKRVLSMFLAILTVVSLFVFPASAVSLPIVSSSKYISTYTYSSSGKVYAYTSSLLSSKTGGYITCSTDECRILKISGNAVQVSYPVSGGRKTAWFSRDKFTYRDLAKDGYASRWTADRSVKMYKWKNNNTFYGSISKGTTVYVLRGNVHNGWAQILIPNGNTYKMGWVNETKATGVKFSVSSVSMTVGSTKQVTSSILPTASNEVIIQYGTSNRNVATVSGNASGTFTITAVGTGTAQVAVKTSSGLVAKLEVTITLKGINNYTKINEGVYTIASAVNNSAVLDVNNGSISSVNGTPVTIWQSNNGNNQKFYIGAAKDGWYYIKHQDSGKVLDINSPKVNGASALIWQYGGGVEPSQCWRFYSVGNGCYLIMNKLGYYLDLSNGGTSNGTKVSQYNGHGRTNQRWKLIAPATSIKLNATSFTLNGGKSSYQLKATISPTYATDKAVTWSSSNQNVAQVSKSGKVTPTGNGTATITSKTANGKTAKATVKVINYVPTKVALSSSSFTLNGPSANKQLTATVTPSNAANTSVTWSSSDTKVAKVSNNGTVTPVADGKATITVKTWNGCKASVTVTVKNCSVQAKVKARLDKIANGTLKYNSSTVLAVGKTFKGTRANEQCKGYAKDVFYLCFGITPGSTQAKPNNHLLNTTSGMKKVGSVTNMTASNIKTLFVKARPGDFVQMRRSHGGSHSAIVYSVTSTGVTFLEANLDGKNTIYKRTYSWSSLCSSNAKISVYTATNYKLK